MRVCKYEQGPRLVRQQSSYMAGRPLPPNSFYIPRCRPNNDSQVGSEPRLVSFVCSPRGPPVRAVLRSGDDDTAWPHITYYMAAIPRRYIACCRVSLARSNSVQRTGVRRFSRRELPASQDQRYRLAKYLPRMHSEMATQTVACLMLEHHLTVRA
jgi:hypothetical protein